MNLHLPVFISVSWFSASLLVSFFICVLSSSLFRRFYMHYSQKSPQTPLHSPPPTCLPFVLKTLSHCEGNLLLCMQQRLIFVCNSHPSLSLSVSLSPAVWMSCLLRSDWPPAAAIYGHRPAVQAGSGAKEEVESLLSKRNMCKLLRIHKNKHATPCFSIHLQLFFSLYNTITSSFIARLSHLLLIPSWLVSLSHYYLLLLT